MYRKIIVAADGSNHSIRATEHAAAIATLTKDTVVEIVVVMDFAKVKSEFLHSQSPENLELEQRKKLFPVEAILKRNNINYQLTMLHGEPGPTIVEYANKQACDMVIIGSRGLNTLQEMVLGSVSHKVAKRVECPVLIVK